jgi:hypothetical protein
MRGRLGGEKPLKPECFVRRVLIEDQEEGESQTMVQGLREDPDQHYQWFCMHFMECVTPSAEWKVKARTQCMSTFIPPGLEAFAVVVYQNAYQRWYDIFRSKDDDTLTEGSSLSSLSGGPPRFLYTNNSRGARKYEGWTSDGTEFYNNVESLIRRQRLNPGCIFDITLLRKAAGKPKNRGSGEGNGAPKANNNLDSLLEIVGL